MTQTEKDMQELNTTPEKLAARQEQLAGITGAPRKTRSDAGKPRETFYVSIPGVRWDLADPDGRAAYELWLSGWLVGQSGALVDTIRQVLREIDRLRAK